MRFCRSRARTDSLTVAALNAQLRNRTDSLTVAARETAARSADGRSGQIAESARPTAIPNDTSKKRWMAICQPLVELGTSSRMATVMLA